MRALLLCWVSCSGLGWLVWFDCLLALNLGFLFAAELLLYLCCIIFECLRFCVFGYAAWVVACFGLTFVVWMESVVGLLACLLLGGVRLLLVGFGVIDELLRGWC